MDLDENDFTQFDAYQKKSQETNRIPYQQKVEALQEMTSDIVPLLGLAGEAGDLLTEYKKKLRDGDAYSSFNNRIKEELGDILWYLANLASRFDLKLSEIANYNLSKTSDRFIEQRSIDALDKSLSPDQMFPRKFAITFKEIPDDGVHKIALHYYQEGDQNAVTQVGAALTNNAFEDDGYKFHDAMHLAFVAILGWSPVMRKLLKDAAIIKKAREGAADEVQDGGRAKVIDEGLVVLIYCYASDRNFMGDVDTVDYQLVRTIKDMTKHLEVNCRTGADWQKAIIDGCTVWRELKKNNGGTLHIDRQERSISYSPPND